MKEKFKDVSLGGSISIKMDAVKGTWVADKKTVLSQIVAVCRQYQEAGDTLTLRQLYYQLVSKDYIPNHDKVYKKLSSLKDAVVYSGLVDWALFEDRGRVPIVAHTEKSIESALQETARHYRLDKQEGQDVHIEVWTEKDAISGILKKVTLPYSVHLVVNKGYSSSTAMYQAYTRFIKRINAGKKVKVLYFGDHDPSGLDMIRDVRTRILDMLTQGLRLDKDLVNDWWDEQGYNVWTIGHYHEKYADLPYVKWDDISDTKRRKMNDLWDEAMNRIYIEENDLWEVVPVGLTMEQIRQFNPPPNPAKITDPRAKWYLKEFGPKSWEVDALSPSVMREVVEAAILDHMDEDTLNRVRGKEAEDKANIQRMINSLK